MELALIFLGIFSSSFLIALSGALMPGPLLTYTVAESARRGFWAGPIIMLGHGFLELGLVVLLLLGIGAIINQPLIMGIVGSRRRDYSLVARLRLNAFRARCPARSYRRRESSHSPVLGRYFHESGQSLLAHLVGVVGFRLCALCLQIWPLGSNIFLCRPFFGRFYLVQPGINGRGPG